MRSSRFVLGSILSGLLLATSAHAIPEDGYEAAYLDRVLPFLRGGESDVFVARDGESLSWVRFVHPNPVGTILVLPGRSEPWVKYGEVFYDLYRAGYSLYAYDHRGQGLSRHLVPDNRQIGHIEDFGDYARDLEDFVERVLVPATGGTNLYLLAHSMGGAIAARYLSRGKTPFRAAALSAPMLTIDTKPFPRPIARIVTGAAIGLGREEAYARKKKQGDFNPNAPFEGNELTSSRARFWMANSAFNLYPASIVGGPSNGWVHRSLAATPKIVRGMKGITTPTLLFQAENDRIVKAKGQKKGCAATPACRRIVVPGAKHELLMERDAIRDPVLSETVRFFR